jgi:dTDP-4-dehydrorhamnose reductase
VNFKDKPILITGGSGLVGEFLGSELKSSGVADLVRPRSTEVDLRKAGDVDALFRDVKPQLVFPVS